MVLNFKTMKKAGEMGSLEIVGLATKPVRRAGIRKFWQVIIEVSKFVSVYASKLALWARKMKPTKKG